MLTETYEKIKPSVVAIVSQVAKDPRFPDIIGTGFCAREDGIIFTNRHVIDAITKLPRFKDGQDEWPIKILYFLQSEKGMGVVVMSVHGVAKISYTPGVDNSYYGEESPDVGIINLRDVKGLPALKIKDDAAFEEGMEVALSGFPMGSDTLKAPGWVHQIGPTLQTGIISAVLPMPCTNPHALLLHVQVQGGSSGSPVFLPDTGEVVGIVYAGLQDQYHFGNANGLNAYNVPTALTYAVPGHILSQVLSKIDEKIPDIATQNKTKIDLKDYIAKQKIHQLTPKTGGFGEPYLGEVIEPKRK